MIQNPPIKQYAIHHTAVSRTKQKTQLYPVDRYHKEKWMMPSSLGWYVGYNYFVDVDGTVTNTRAVGEETIANIGHNCDVVGRCDTISICLAGDFNLEMPLDAQISSLRGLIAQLRLRYPNIGYTTHRAIQPSRTCPGNLYTDEFHKSAVLGDAGFPDHEDKIKQEEIEKMTKQLDWIRAEIARLTKLLKKPK
jgi:N-acetyl-anhydromuramyl-L-alanine amidase AmpD